MTADQQYYAYSRQRDTGPVVTDHKFTGQKLDATGLQYFNARYYDPEIGQFISPDTLVPDPGRLLDYNRYAYARANPMRYNDPSGHQATCSMDADGNMSCSDNAVTGGHTLTIDLADEAPPSTPGSGRQFFVTMGGLLVGSFTAAFVAPYLAALLPATAEGGAATVTTACADGDCTNEVNAVTQIAQKSVNSTQILISAATKTEARDLLRSGIEKLTTEQTQRALQVLAKGRVDSFTVTTASNNQTQLIAQRAGNDGFQRLTYTVDPSGKIISFLQEAYNSAGELVHSHDKLNNIIIK